MDNQIGKRPYGYIYVSFFPPTEKVNFERFYIGQKKLTKINHYSFDPDYHGSGRIVQEFIKSVGNTKIKTYCLIYAYSQKELNELENYWISFKLRSKNYPDSLNLRPGGMQPGMTDETKHLISVKNKGRIRTDDEKKKLSEARFRYYARCPDARTKINASRIRKVFCLETGMVFVSSVEAAKFNGKTNNGAILGCCKKLKKRKTAGGCHWMFLDEYLISSRQSNSQAFFDFA